MKRYRTGWVSDVHLGTRGSKAVRADGRVGQFGHFIFARRLWIGLAVVAMAAFVVEPRLMFGRYQAIGTAVSLALVIAGLLGRAWGAGCAGRHTREARIEAPALVTGGPYAYVRNPIYLASIVLGLGMVGLVGDPRLFAIHAAVCVLLYAAIVPAEERFLAAKFGEEYSRYRAHVPRLWPRFRAWSGAQPVSFEPRALLDQVWLAVVLALIYAGLHIAARLRG
jgi:protein-S-isoprenylcysteine O-methyltransferase Ste14